MKKLFLATALALSSLTAMPAAAQSVDWSVTVGNGNQYSYPGYSYPGYQNQYNPYQGYQNPYQGYQGYNTYNRPYGAFMGGAQCGFNGTPVVINNLRTNSGVIYVSTRNRGREFDQRLRGDRYRASNVVCIRHNDLSFNRTATIIHDVNNNGYFDQADGIGYVRLNNRQSYGYGYGYGNGNAYGATRPEVVSLRYNYDGWRR